ncbi:MAG: hypothetical protein GY715_07785 [Planctomycetes bacterium]|nr:hypothetical protein [Planctomycetota bacterium]
MPKQMHICIAVAIVCQAMTIRTMAEVTTYTNEAAYMTALTANGFVPVHEGFEDDAVWGAVRSTIPGGPQSAPSVTNLGITWTSSSANNGVSTSMGAARSGQWGFYSLPHGDYANGITDGWRGTAAQPLVAIGGWVRTNTPFAALIVFLDGNEQNPFDFDGDNILGTGGHRFFGVIETSGFSAFDFRETEGTIGDQKLIFGDDFTFAVGGVIQDCNENGMVDAFDITSGASTDCNNNVIPDECEIDESSQAPGGPFFCTEQCASDCNDNGLLDACEVTMADPYASGALSPIGNGSPQGFTIPSAPQTLGNVVMSFTAHANLGGGPDHISVSINGTSVGTVFGPDGSDCPETGPDEAELIVPMATFNDAVNGGDAVIDLVASAEVDPEGCDQPTFVTVDVLLFVPSAADTNENGIPDECECPADVTGDGDVGFGDILAIIGAWGPCAGACPEDLSGNGSVDFADILAVIGAWGPCA